MKRIQINKQTVNVPENWDDITLGFYESWFDKTPSSHREKVDLTAKICCTDPALLLNASPAAFNRITSMLSFLFDEQIPDPLPVIEVKGVKYMAPIREELTMAQWVDADEIRWGNEKNLSGLLAVVCLPQGEKYDPARFDERQQMFASLKMSKVLGMLGFFLLYKNRYESLSQTCLKLRETAAQFLKDTKIFRRDGGGIRLSQMWRRIKLLLLTLWLHYRLRRFLHLFATKSKNMNQKWNNNNLKIN